MKFEWLIINDTFSGETERAKVFGGWLVWRSEINKRERTNGYMEDDVRDTSMVFVPDPKHEWEIE